MGAPDAKALTPHELQQRRSAAVKHGAYSLLKLAPRADELADTLRELVPLGSAADDPIVSVLAITLAQLERAALALGVVQQREVERLQSGEPTDSTDRDDLRRLAQDARGWANSALRLAESLGLTPASRARLGLDVARAQRVLTITELHAAAEERA